MRSVKALELFRPLVLAQQWDYVVVWKLGNDPSRFIEWIGCCCSGGCANGDIDTKEEKSEKKLLCKDIYLKHSVSTKACVSLSLFPSSMDLYSGVHTEVVISRQPKWLNQVDESESVPSNDDFGTRVFVPVEGGLIELYSTENIPKDQKVLEMVLAHWEKISLEEETDSQSCITIDGSLSINSSISNPSIHQYFSSDSNTKHESRHRHFETIDRGDEFSTKQAEKNAKRVTKRKEKGDYHSKNLLAERERRNRIRNGLLTLRSLVPKITKMDMASILGDAVNYIGDLQMEETELRDELKKLREQEDSDKAKGLDDRSLLTEKISRSSMFCPKRQPEVKVEVNQIGEKEFFIKLFLAHKRGGFVRLLEIIDSLNLQVVSVNSVAFNGRVQNILEVKAQKVIEPKKLRDFFVELTSERAQSISKESMKQIYQK